MVRPRVVGISCNPRHIPTRFPTAAGNALLDRSVAPRHSTRGGCGVRVYFDHQERFRLFGANQLQVVVSVLFTELEQTIIDQYGLHCLAVLERSPAVYRDADGARRETDHNIYLGQFIKHAYVETVASPTHAAVFEQEMLAGLENLKAYLNVSATSPQAKVYDL